MAPVPMVFMDNLISFMSGLGVAGRDKNVGMSHSVTLLTRVDLEAAYRSDWIARKIVDLPAKDSTREWRAWQTEGAAIEALEAEENRLNIQKKVYQALRLSRLYGGSVMILGIKNGLSTEPVDVEAVKQGDLDFVHVASQHSINAGPVITDLLSPWYGEPSYYTTSTTTPIFAKEIGTELGMMIHPSRVVLVRGMEFPDAGAATLGTINPIWGDPVLQTVMDAVKQASMVAQSTATMVNEAKLDIIKIPELSQLMASQEYRNRLTERFAYANVSKSLINTLMLDTAEEWERINANFGQLPELVRTFLLLVSGAADIPATRFLGQSPVGMSATGESDIRNYYDRISSDQNTELTPLMSRLDEVLIRSALGKRDPSLYYLWNPLWQMDAVQAAQVHKIKADIFQIDVNTGLIDPEALRIGRQNQLIEDGVYPGLEEALEAQKLMGEASMLSPEEQQAEEMDLEKQKLKLQASFAPSPAAGAAKKPNLRVVGKDAAPLPLYVYRPLLNYKDVVKWAKGQGFKVTVGDDMHVTVIYSRMPVDWMKASSEWNEERDGSFRVAPGGPRMLEKFNDAVVLTFVSSQLCWRHESIKRDTGASSDYEYQPHVTITYDPGKLNLKGVEPYRGELIFGPEVFEEINDEYKSTLVEDRQPWDPTKHPRCGGGGEYLDANPYHEPAGSPVGGRFASKADALSVAKDLGLPTATRDPDQPVYLRIGGWNPEYPYSSNFAKGDIETGLSVYEIDTNGKLIVPAEGEWAEQDMNARLVSEEPKFLVQGDLAGEGNDGEPLLASPVVVGGYKIIKLKDFNPNHAPAGSPKGGEFTEGEMGVIRPPLEGLAPGSDPALISPSKVTAKDRSARGDSDKLHLGVTLEALKLDPKLFERNVNLLRDASFYPMLRPSDITGSADEVAENFIEMARGNIEFMYSQANAGQLRAADWYNNARSFIRSKAAQYDLNPAAVTAAFARLSPQKDWSQNVYLGERLVDIVMTKQDFKWDAKMEAKGKELWGPNPGQPGRDVNMAETVMAPLRGKTYGELTDLVQRAQWVRTYDEAYSDRHFSLIGVDGTKEGMAKNKANKQGVAQFSVAGWQSTEVIASAIASLESKGDRIVISNEMGDKHKVRNFYNNLLDPGANNGDVTIDTHAVGADLMLPVGQNSVPVLHNFGNAPAPGMKLEGWASAGKSAKLGISGLYPLHAEAYRRAAANLKVRSSDLQAVVWNVKRDEFPSTSTAQEAVSDLWKKYYDGKLSLDDTRKRIMTYVRSSPGSSEREAA